MHDAHFDNHQFQGVGLKRAVHAEVGAGGQWTSNGIDYSDYGRMRTQTCKPSRERRLPTPEWAVNDNLLRDVVLRYLEKRALIRLTIGTPSERLARVQKDLAADVPRMNALLNKLCKRYVDAKNAPMRNLTKIRRLEIAIEGLDTDLRLVTGNVGVILRVVHLYYRLGFASVEVGEEVHLKPPHVRQILYRLNRIAEGKSNERALEMRRQSYRTRVSVARQSATG